MFKCAEEQLCTGVRGANGGGGGERAALNNSLQVKCHLQGCFLFCLGFLGGAFWVGLFGFILLFGRPFPIILQGEREWQGRGRALLILNNGLQRHLGLLFGWGRTWQRPNPTSSSPNRTVKVGIFKRLHTNSRTPGLFVTSKEVGVSALFLERSYFNQSSSFQSF